MSSKNYEPLSFLLDTLLYPYQKEVLSTVEKYWQHNMNLIFHKRGKRVGRTTIATTIYWLLKEKGQKVLFASKYLVDDTVPQSDVISSIDNLNMHRGKRVDVIVFDGCQIEEVEMAMSTLNAKGIIFNDNEELDPQNIARNFIKTLDAMSTEVDEILHNMVDLPRYMTDTISKWDRSSDATKMDIAYMFAEAYKPSFMSGAYIYKDFDNIDECDI